LINVTPFIQKSLTVLSKNTQPQQRQKVMRIGMPGRTFSAGPGLGAPGSMWIDPEFRLRICQKSLERKKAFSTLSLY